MAKLSQSEINALKARLPEYMARYGLTLTAKKNIPCISGSHTDKNPSMSYNPNGHYLKCFSCDASYNIYSACEHLEGLAKGQGVNRIKEIFNVGQKQDFNQTNTNMQQPKQPQTPSQPMTEALQPTAETPAPTYKDFSDLVAQAHSQLSTGSYHLVRGISQATAERFKLGYVRNANGMQQALIIPLKRLDGSYSYQQRNTDPEAPKEKRHYKPSASMGGTGELFNQEVIGNTDKPIFIVEGSLDALSIIEAGGEAVALNGVGTSKLLELVSKHKSKNTLVLSLDNDEAGRNAQAKLKEELLALFATPDGQKTTAPVYELNLCYNNPKLKDANELLTANPDNFKAFISSLKDEKTVKRIIHKIRTVEADLLDFLGYVNTHRPPAKPTGFKLLDTPLRGGFREGLICIGGISSLGKTTLALQIMDNFAQQGHDVLIFSLEMGRHELRAKSIARESYLLDSRYAVSTVEVLDKQLRDQLMPEQQDNVKKAINKYYSYARHVHIHEAVGKFTVNDVKAIVEEHIEATGRTPVVMVDYLQILQPAEKNLNDKAKVSYDVLMLKQLSRDKHTPVVVVSSFNRDSYKAEASFSSFKESGEIEYSADVLLGLQLTALRTGRDPQEALEEAYREIDVKILKNRNGTLGIASFKARLAHNHFREMDKDELEEVRATIQNKERREEAKKNKARS